MTKAELKKLHALKLYFYLKYEIECRIKNKFDLRIEVLDLRYRNFEGIKNTKYPPIKNNLWWQVFTELENDYPKYTFDYTNMGFSFWYRGSFRMTKKKIGK